MHGGGKAINEALSHYDIPVEFKNGQRVTTPAIMDIVREVLGGKALGNDRCDCNPGNIQMESNHQDQV